MKAILSTVSEQKKYTLGRFKINNKSKDNESNRIKKTNFRNSNLSD